MSKLFLRFSIPALAALLALGQLSFAGPKPPPPPPPPPPKLPIIFPPIIFPPKPPVILPPPVVIVPPPVIITPPSPPIVVVTPPAPPVIVGSDPLAGNNAAALQTQKYLQVTNNTASRLQVFALYLGDDGKGQGAWLPAPDKDGANQPITATLEPGETYTLVASDSTKVLTSRVRVWAKTDSKQWLKYQSEDLVLVDKPYQADRPGTFPMQFGQ
ncbi:MAG TPA: hypothetical protein VKS79_26005 [Gemmataceae bacterium]|nr:hypothetical protein [Gemmataceae bacterium]